MELYYGILAFSFVTLLSICVAAGVFHFRFDRHAVLRAGWPTLNRFNLAGISGAFVSLGVLSGVASLFV